MCGDLWVVSSKVCIKCGQKFPKDLVYFKAHRGYLHSWCKNCHKEYNKNYRDTHPEYFSNYYIENKEHKAQYAKEYVALNREKVADRRREYKENNREKISAKNKIYNKMYYDSHKEEYHIKSYNYRAMKRNAKGKFTIADVRRLKEKQNFKCLYCGCDLGDAFHIDHFIPLSKGGSNFPSNLVLSCEKDNLNKRDKLPNRWRRWNGEYPVE